VDFADFARNHGLIIDDLYPSDRIRRCGTETNPRKRNGAYLYLGDRGWIQRWDEGGEVVWWKDPNAKERTQQDIDNWRAQRRKAEQEQEALHTKAAKQSTEYLKQATQRDHPYLHIKGFPDARGFVLERYLLIPMRNHETHKLQGLQQIWWEEEKRVYVKKMLYGSRAKGAVIVLGDRDANEVCLCEGYATGLSIHKACRSVGLATAVMVCFSANNITHLAPLIKTKKRWVFADNDASGTGERVAKETGLPYAMSPHLGMDANDHHHKHGLMSLVGLIMKARAAC
jgi:phage/plasmid primase-like uncharacterized protein